MALTVVTPRGELPARTARATYVAPRLRVAFVPTRKAACTSIAWLLADLNRDGLRFRRDLVSRPENGNQKVHVSSLYDVPPLAYESRAHRQSIDESWLVFSVVRNPYTRLWSAWQNKLLLSQGNLGNGFLRIRSRILEKGPNAVLSAFHHFVHDVTSSEKLLNSDDHLVPQTRWLAHRRFRYSHVGRVESLSETLDALAAHTGKPVQLQRQNPGLLPWSPELYGRSEVQKMQSAFAEDFDLFGYSPTPPGGRDLSDLLTRIEESRGVLQELADTNRRLYLVARSPANLAVGRVQELAGHFRQSPASSMRFLMLNLAERLLVHESASALRAEGRSG